MFDFIITIMQIDDYVLYYLEKMQNIYLTKAR